MMIFTVSKLDIKNRRIYLRHRVYYQSIFKRNNNFFSYYQIPRYIASEEVQWDLMPLLGIIELYYKAHPILREGDRKNIEITVSADGVSYYKNRYWF